MDQSNNQEFSGSEYSNLDYIPRERGVFLQHHQPKVLAKPYHFHPSIEVNFLQGCDMTYSFSGEEVLVPRGRFCVFWAARPHRTIAVSDEGTITNVYISLSEFLRWGMPAEFVNLLLSGAVLSSKSEQNGDSALADRWATEITRTGPEWQRLHALELQARLHRMSVEGVNILFRPTQGQNERMIGGKAIIHFEKMLRFIAEYFSDRITIGIVAQSAGVSTNYAISLFNKMLQRTIKQHITDVRVYHAQMLLAETEAKILTIAMDCGFGSLSSFYRTFHSATGVSPAVFRRNIGRFTNT